MPRCSRCNRDTDDEGRFCKHCGFPTEAVASDPGSNDDTLILRLFDERAEEAVLRRARIWLIDPDGEHIAQTCDLKDEITIIGRQPDCAISLPSSTVSRHHAQIRQEGNHFFLRDLNSTNGTLLNREPVIGEELLHDRDEIGIGIYRLIFRYS